MLPGDGYFPSSSRLARLLGTSTAVPVAIFESAGRDVAGAGRWRLSAFSPLLLLVGRGGFDSRQVKTLSCFTVNWA